MTSLQRWRGLVALVQSAVENGSIAVERVQKDTARLPFGALEAMPEIGGVARVVHQVHDGCVTGVHGSIRLVTRVVGKTVGVVLEALDEPQGGS